MLVFACFSPHAPILLPNIGSAADREKVKNTIESLDSLGKKLAKIAPEMIVVTSPHPDWGFNVPLHFLANKLKNVQIKPYLTGFESTTVHFEKGKIIASNFPPKKKIAWIASGDMSHRLKKDGPYGLHPAGPLFDKKFIQLLKRRDISRILNIEEALVQEAGECGLRSFCQLLGALTELKIDWQPEILSYESPFGVGYLVANFEFKK